MKIIVCEACKGEKTGDCPVCMGTGCTIELVPDPTGVEVRYALPPMVPKDLTKEQFFVTLEAALQQGVSVPPLPPFVLRELRVALPTHLIPMHLQEGDELSLSWKTGPMTACQFKGVLTLQVLSGEVVLDAKHGVICHVVTNP